MKSKYEPNVTVDDNGDETDTVSVILSDAHISVIFDGVFEAVREDSYRPRRFVHSKVVDNLQNAGYELVEYAGIDVDLDLQAGPLYTVEFDVRVVIS